MSYCKQCKVIVEVRSGRELMSKKMFEKPATYVKVWVDEMSDKTETIPDLENPVWNRTFEFALDHKPKKITLEVKDDRTLLPNVKLGNYVIDLDGINFDSTQPVKILDGEVQLVDTTQGMLDVAVIVGPQGLDNRVNNNDSNINNMNNMNNNNNNNNVNQQNLSMNDELIISLMDAQGLKKSDLLSQSDPYVKIRVGNDEQKSSTVKNNDNPIWNENFTFANVDFNNLPNIEFKIMDKDVLIDDNIGIGIIDYNNIANNFGNEINVPIKLKDKQAGFLRLKLQRNNNNYNSNMTNQSRDYNMNSNDDFGNNNNNNNNDNYVKKYMSKNNSSITNCTYKRQTSNNRRRNYL